MCDKLWLCVCGDGYKYGQEYQTWLTLKDASFRSSWDLLRGQVLAITKERLIVGNDEGKENSVFNLVDLHSSKKALPVLRKGPKCCAPVWPSHCNILLCIGKVTRTRGLGFLLVLGHQKAGGVYR